MYNLQRPHHTHKIIKLMIRMFKPCCLKKNDVSFLNVRSRKTMCVHAVSRCFTLFRGSFTPFHARFFGCLRDEKIAALIVKYSLFLPSMSKLINSYLIMTFQINYSNIFCQKLTLKKNTLSLEKYNGTGWNMSICAKDDFALSGYITEGLD